MSRSVVRAWDLLGFDSFRLPVDEELLVVSRNDYAARLHPTLFLPFNE